jgi:hypothetical protein
MNEDLRDIVMAEALDVRYWAEGQARGARQDDLAGWCARASAELHTRLQRLNIDSEIHMWYWNRDASAHVFLVVHDHVVDVTASQFREFRHQLVNIMHVRLAQVYEFYQSREQFTSAVTLRRVQQQRRWPWDQVALTS